MSIEKWEGKEHRIRLACQFKASRLREGSLERVGDQQGASVAVPMVTV